MIEVTGSKFVTDEIGKDFLKEKIKDLESASISSIKPMQVSTKIGKRKRFQNTNQKKVVITLNDELKNIKVTCQNIQN